MDKTLFELVPVSVKPDEDDWYSVSSPHLFPDVCWYDSESGWDNPYNYTHYLRPLPPTVAEERTFTLDEMLDAMARMWVDRGENKHTFAEYCKQCVKAKFNITLPE